MTTSWTPEMIQTEANKFETLSTWKTGSPKNYSGIDAYDSLMVAEVLNKNVNIKKVSHLTSEKIQEDAYSYRNRLAWMQGSPYIYELACKQDLVDICVSHMIAPPLYWMPEAIQEEAYTYRNRLSCVNTMPNSYHSANVFGGAGNHISHINKDKVSQRQIRHYAMA